MKATPQPCWANSSATERPSPVAPPVTTATRPCRVPPARSGSGRSCTAATPAGAGASRAPTDHEEGTKSSEPMFELEHRQGAAHLSLHDPPGVGRRRRYRRGGVRSPRPRPRRDDQRRLAAHRRRVHLRHRFPVLLEVPGRSRLWSRRRARHSRRAVQQRARLRADQPLGAVRPSLRRDRGRRSAGGTGAGGAIRVPPRHAVVGDRRRVRGGRPGLHRSLLLPAARRQVPRRWWRCWPS